MRQFSAAAVTAYIIFCFAVSPFLQASPATAPALTAYDPAPDHLWNRLHAALFVRPTGSDPIAGLDRVDPLLWPESTHLLTGPSHARAIAVLDEFLGHAGESLVADPLRRTLLQHDLWTVFDWTANSYDPQARDKYMAERQGLQSRLAKAIGQLAESDKSIDDLPDNYALALGANAYPPRYDPTHPDQPFLPPELFDEKGPWVCLGIPGGIIATPAHTAAASGRSVFLAFLRLPDGRAATLDYMYKLATFPKPWLLNSNFGPGPAGDPEPVQINPDTPQFPAGTQVALVRQMVSIDSQGRLRPTHLTQTVQLRVYRKIWPLPTGRNSPEPAKEAQAVFEFKLNRADLLSGRAGGLRAVGPDERDYIHFNTMPFDPIGADGNVKGDRPRVLEMCIGCHTSPGVFSLETHVRGFSQHDTRPAGLSNYSVEFIRQGTTYWKKKQYDWGLLQGLLRQER